MGYSMDGLLAGASQLADTTYTIVWIVLGMVAIGGLFLYISFIGQFKHKIRIKDIAGGRKIIFDDKFREVKKKTGEVHWHLYKRNERCPIAPSQAIELDTRGRKVVEAYRIGTGEYIFAVDKCSNEIEEIMNLTEERERQNKLSKWKKENKVIDAYQPVSTNQRVMLINQIKMAQSRKTKRWQDFIMPVVGIGACVILIISLMIFWGDLAKPILSMGERQAEWQKQQVKMLELQKEIQQDVQIIKGEDLGTEGKEPPG